MALKMWAAHDARTGERIGKWRYSFKQAERDCDALTKKGTEAVVDSNELKG
jgi:hypothetical protein